MKTSLQKISTGTTLRFYTKRMFYVLMAAVCICSFNNMYGKDKPSENNRNPSGSINNINTGLEWINLKGYADNQSNLLQWEVSDATDIVSFTVKQSIGNELNFQEKLSMQPLQCNDADKKNCFVFKSINDGEQAVVYYKIMITYKDNHTLESGFIAIQRTEKVASLNISNIQNESGLVTLTFKSPKAQDITLSIVNRAGQLLAVKNIIASEGDNTYIYDATFINSTEMLIFSLNNQEEQITKKYMLALAW